MIKTKTQGFTLIELLVVIGIIGILAALVLLAINPAETQRKGRDATRFSDMTTMRKAIDLTIADSGGTLPGGTGIPPSAPVHLGDSSLGRQASNTPENYLKMDVSKFLSILPNDPQHVAGSILTVSISDGTTVTKDQMRYYYAADGRNYEFNAYLESQDNNSKALNTGDGGTDNKRYEIGTDPGLDLIN